MNQQHSQPVTELLVLVHWRAGGQDTLQALVPLVYKGLRDIARHHLRRERVGHTLQSCYPVSTRINSVANDDEECSAPVELAQIQDRLFSF